ncbi:MAG: glycosyltransferase [Coprococcus sp.]|nr:glycosyltransferase [Coprococcus sp.]
MTETLYIVIPCYNEELVISETVRRLTEKLDSMVEHGLIKENSRMMLVNDGSKDNTWNIIEELYSSNKYVTGISLSRNRGHQNALLAGLFEAAKYSDMVVSMDADLQDDIEVLDDFVKKYYEGCQIVYGVRKNRKKDSFFKRTTALAFYKMMNMLGVELVYNHADYRLMSRRAIHELENYKEVNLFLRGIVPMIGFQTGTVAYDRGERFAGESKYPLGKMIYFALDGITSTTVKPIRMITAMGFITALISLVFLIYFIVIHFLGKTVAGWTTTVVLVCLFGGLQIMCIGVVGEYVGKIYLETKKRPRYIVQDILHK